MSGIIVVIRPDQGRDEWMQAMSNAGLTFAEYSHLDRIFHVDGVAVETFPLADHPGCASIEPANLQMGSAAPQTINLDQYLTTSSWGLARMIRRRAPWPTNPGQFPQSTYYRCVRDGAGVDIYLVDTGVRTTHAEFGGRASNVYDASGAGPVYFHGTCCASLAAGGTTGPARSANVFSFQWAGADGTGTSSQIVAAMDQALAHYNGRSATNRPAVVNLSITGASSSVNSAVSAMIDAGMVVVAAAGNETSSLGVVDVLPAESDADAIVVGGSTACDIPYYLTELGSNYGARVDICAPSQSVYMATNTGDSSFRVSSGTSYGTAYAAGAIACMLQGHPRLTSRAQVQAVRNHVRNTATTGKMRSTPQQVLPDRLLYLNPDLTTETIAGL